MPMYPASKYQNYFKIFLIRPCEPCKGEAISLNIYYYRLEMRLLRLRFDFTPRGALVAPLSARARNDGIL